MRPALERISYWSVAVMTIRTNEVAPRTWLVLQGARSGIAMRLGLNAKNGYAKQTCYY